MLLDEDGKVGNIYGVRGIPVTFFIDRDGIIKDKKIGAFENKAEIDWRLINSIIKED